MGPPIFTMKSVTNEKTEPEQAIKRKTKTNKIWIIHKVWSILAIFDSKNRLNG